jgi:hypothetical protein
MVYGREKIPFLVRVWTTFKGEAITWANHTFNVMKDGLIIIESNPGRTKISTWAKYDTPKYWGVLVGVVGFTEYDRELWDAFSTKMLNEKYGYFAILKHGIDGYISNIAGRDIRLARRFCLKKTPMSYNICSWLTAWALNRIGVRVYDWVSHIRRVSKGSRIRIELKQYFDTVEPETVNPDTIFDNVFNTFTPNPEEDTSPKFIIIQEFGVRPKDLNRKVIEKIERDAKYIEENPALFGVVLP